MTVLFAQPEPAAAPAASCGRRVPQGIILAIDPGHEQSAYVLYDPETRRPLAFAKIDNASLLKAITDQDGFAVSPWHMVIEQIASFGMAVGAEVFETVFWSGRFAQAWADNHRRGWSRVKRLAVKMHLCADSRAKDKNIRQALIDRYGPGTEKAIGKKHHPGPLHGVHHDIWSALAVAITWAEQPQAAAGGAK